MRHILLLVILILLVIQSSFAQKQDQQWLFNWWSADDWNYAPEFSDISGASILDFNTLPPIGYRQKEITLDMGEESGLICDADGQLLLYSNGQSIHGPNHKPIIGGDTINFSPKWSALTWSNENGVRKPSGMRYVQAVGFVPVPESDTILALYHNYENFDVVSQEGHFSLWASKIVREGDDYVIVDKDRVIDDNVRLAGNIHACRHANGRDWWMLQFYGIEYAAYLISPSGISLDHMDQLPFELRPLSQGQSKFSQKGDKFALYGLNLIGTADGMDLMIADFDRCTGLLYSAKLDTLPTIDNVISNGLEFSPSGELLYISTVRDIFQYDLTATDIFDTKISVAQYDETICEDDARSPTVFGLMQLGADNKIYIGRAVQCFNIHVINHPDIQGEECEVMQNSIFLPTYTNGTMPNVNTYRLGSIDGSMCDTLGIDNNPVSRFWYEQPDTMEVLDVQFHDVSYFRPEMWSWDFGDGMTSMEQSPQHSYSQNGVYEVCLTVSNENSSNTSCETLNIGSVAVDDIAVDVKINIFPNPVMTHTRIVWQNYLPVSAHVELLDINGRIIFREKLHGSEQVIDMSILPAGIYLVKLYDQNRVVYSEQLIKM